MATVTDITSHLACPDCAQTFMSPQGLGAHRSRAHGYRSDKPAASKDAKAPVIVELVDEEPPPPPEPKRKPLEQILDLVEAADFETGRWWRVAVFPTGRAAKAAATRLRGHEYGSQLDWLAADDGRVFVRVPENAPG
jgi:uncharacterized C2H2 Zn-finger protein